MPTTKVRCLNSPLNPRKRILFLGYTKSQTSIIDDLIRYQCYVDHTDQPIDGNGKYDFVVSFGYRHILRPNVIEGIECPIFNLHISYLPYNRGAHPNFWSFYDNTPTGVTIHLMDGGIDTGPIVYQRYVNFDKREDTFLKTYSRLNYEIEELFVQNLEEILSDKWVAKPQRGVGSRHYIKDLPRNFSGWEEKIANEMEKLDKEGLLYE